MQNDKNVSYTEPYYDTDLTNKAYVDKVVSEGVDEAESIATQKSQNFGTQPNPPYHVNDTYMNGTDIYICVNERLIGNFVASDWQKASTYDNTKSILDGGVTTDGTLVVAKGGTVAAGMTAYTSGDDGVRMWAGADINGINSAPFRVTQRGEVTSSNMNITGGRVSLTAANANDVRLHIGLTNNTDTYTDLSHLYLYNTLKVGNDTYTTAIGHILHDGVSISHSNDDSSIMSNAVLTANQLEIIDLTHPVIHGGISYFQNTTVTPDYTDTPKIIAGNIDCGTATLKSSNDTWVSFNKTFENPPIVVLTCTQNNAYGFAGCVHGVSTTGFYGYIGWITSDPSKTAVYNWIAIGT